MSIGWNGYDPNDNKQLWKLWDKFGITYADMYGWWNSTTPVGLKCVTNESGAVYATSYVRKGLSAMIAIASWSNTTTHVQLQIDLDVLGLRENETSVILPYIPSFNGGNTTKVFSPRDKLLVRPLKGLLVILEHN